ncbi:MAG: hypothetical protein IJ348_04115 [Alistipes sp.]|nr:hypothetical protein [Alistipes sp.]
MGLFSPVKRRANAFNYIPRYYDPEKERREQRRRELRGESVADEGQEYKPGQYLRTMREARNQRRSEQKSREGGILSKAGILIIGVLLLVFVYVLYPRLVNIFTMASRPARESVQQQAEVEEFNPYTPITIVPNDYKEE